MDLLLFCQAAFTVYPATFIDFSVPAIDNSHTKRNKMQEIT